MTLISILNYNNNIITIIVILLLILLLNCRCNKSYEAFDFNSYSSKDLNDMLIKVINLLNKNNLNQWFLGYGTLLGIIRNNSCINNDDDIDIIIDIKDKKKLNELIDKNNYKYIYNLPNFIKIEIEKNKPTVDFYLAKVDDANNFEDTWESAIWSNSKPFIIKEWNTLKLQLPNNYKTKLINRYGKDWIIPQKSKGIYPRKKIL
jgi:hypothetical protein